MYLSIMPVGLCSEELLLQAAHQAQHLGRGWALQAGRNRGAQVGLRLLRAHDCCQRGYRPRLPCTSTPWSAGTTAPMPQSQAEGGQGASSAVPGSFNVMAALSEQKGCLLLKSMLCMTRADLQHRCIPFVGVLSGASSFCLSGSAVPG